MKHGIKIVTIGGGSSYTPELMEGFIKRYPELPSGKFGWSMSKTEKKR